jgi:hypothetical protein
VIGPNVGLEPQLQPLSGETFQHKTSSTDDQARLDIQAQNFWDNSNQTTFFDVRVFNAHAPSNCLSTNACYRKHELEKRRKYEQRIIEVDHGIFTPLVFFIQWWMDPRNHHGPQEASQSHG